MTICRFYANGFCRYGNSCRFEHTDNTRDYYKNTYNRNDGRYVDQYDGRSDGRYVNQYDGRSDGRYVNQYDGRYSNQYDGRYDSRQSQPVNTPNKVGFSFNQTLSGATNRGFGQQMTSNSYSTNFRQRETQMSGYNRNVSQFSNNSVPTNQKSGTFSFNQTLQQISTNNRPSSRLVVYDDIEMDSGTVNRMPANSGPQTNTFGLFSQSNNSVKTQINSNPSIDSKSDSDHKLNDIYSKITDLTENHKKQFESNAFTFRSIPVCPPPQSLC